MADVIALSWLSVNHDPYHSTDRKTKYLEAGAGRVPGPSLVLACDPTWGRRIARYVLFHQSKHAHEASALRAAFTPARSSTGLPPVEVELKDMGDFNPTNHRAIFDRLTPSLKELTTRFPPCAQTRPFEPGSPLASFWGDRAFDRNTLDLVSQTPTEVLAADSEWHRMEQTRRVSSHEYLICLSQGTPAMHAVWLTIVQAEILLATLVQTVPPDASRQTKGEGALVERVELSAERQRTDVIERVGLDLTRLPIPTVETIREQAQREWDQLSRLGPVAVLSHFMSANLYRGDPSYGLYRLTHSPTSEVQVRQSLDRFDRDFDLLKAKLSPQTSEAVERFVQAARAAWSRDGWEGYRSWWAEDRGSVKRHLRLSLGQWVEKVRRLHPDLQISAEWARDAEFDRDVYCDVAVVERGLDAIVENVASRAYPDGTERPLAIRVSRDEASLRIEIEDNGVGLDRPADRFRKGNGSTGCGLADIRTLAEVGWFDVTVETGHKVRYHVRPGHEEMIRSQGTGTRYVLTCRLPPTRPSVPTGEVA